MSDAPEFEALAELAACAAVFMAGLTTYTNRYPTAAERLQQALDRVYPQWRDGQPETPS